MRLAEEVPSIILPYWPYPDDRNELWRAEYSGSLLAILTHVSVLRPGYPALSQSYAECNE